jgi:hypothetical protein
MKDNSIESIMLFVLKEILVLTKENRELREEVKELKETQSKKDWHIKPFKAEVPLGMMMAAPPASESEELDNWIAMNEANIAILEKIQFLLEPLILNGPSKDLAKKKDQEISSQIKGIRKDIMVRIFENIQNTSLLNVTQATTEANNVADRIEGVKAILEFATETINLMNKLIAHDWIGFVNTIDPWKTKIEKLGGN